MKIPPTVLCCLHVHRLGGNFKYAMELATTGKLTCSISATTFSPLCALATQHSQPVGVFPAGRPPLAIGRLSPSPAITGVRCRLQPLDATDTLKSLTYNGGRFTNQFCGTSKRRCGSGNRRRLALGWPAPRRVRCIMHLSAPRSKQRNEPLRPALFV